MTIVSIMVINKRVLPLVGYAIALVVLAYPVIHERLDSRNLGFPLNYGSDYGHYLVRLEQGLVAPGSDTSNGIFSVPDSPPGFQPGGMEKVVGFLFSWTNWNATTVMMLLSVLFGALIVPLLQQLLKRTGLGDRTALLGGLLYFFLFLGPMQRFVHSSWSLPLAVLSLFFVWRFWDRPQFFSAITAGLILGLLPHVYLWGWTFVWCTTGLLTLCMFLPHVDNKRQRVTLFAVLWLCAMAVSLPYFLHLLHLSSEPLSREVAERSSVIFARGIESYPRSILTLLLATLGCVLLVRTRAKASITLLPVACLCVTSFIVLHQQFIHGEVISFSTHYYPYICIAALVFAGALIARRRWSIPSLSALLLCIVFLGAAFLDYNRRFQMIFTIDADRYHFQHFSTLLPVLTADSSKEVIITDPLSALAVAASTKHDVVFTEHARHLLISTDEYAERYCTAMMFDPTATGLWIPEILREPSTLGRAREAELYTERLQIATDACKRVKANRAAYLQKYQVTELLWDEKDYPSWKIDASLFRLERQGQGWSLWRRTGM